MTRSVRFGALLREISADQRVVSYSALMPDTPRDAAGNATPYGRAARLKLRPVEVVRIIEPYVSVRFRAQLRAVVPLALYLVLFQILILRQGIAGATTIGAGLLSVMIGLMLFMEGLKVGLMPFGETMGTTLPRKSKLPFVLLIAFLLGIGVTFAEPAIGALKAAGAIVTLERAPYLYAMLNVHADKLVLVVGSGVGLAVVLGTLRFLNGWSLKPLIYLSLLPTIGLTLWVASIPELRETLGLAWDCGAVTTGPVTVPLVLALGIGIVNAAGRQGSSLSGFGIVTLASLFPIIAVMGLALWLHATTPVAEIIAASRAADDGTAAGWLQQTPMAEIVGGLRAIVPLVAFLLIVLLAILRQRLPNAGEIAYGIVLCVAGMILFNLGLSYGLARLGGQSGSLVPAAFMSIDAVAASPLYAATLGLAVAGLFAWVLGFGATLAEPALNALGMTVESLTNGAFRKSVLMLAVSTGVGFGILVGVFKIVFEIPLAFLVVPGYAIAVGLTAISTEEYVNVAWDSAGVTTGPVTVPLVLAMGLGFGKAVGVAEGFGILSMASIGPIIAVLATGRYIHWQIGRRHLREQGDDDAESRS